MVHTENSVTTGQLDNAFVLVYLSIIICISYIQWDILNSLLVLNTIVLKFL